MATSTINYASAATITMDLAALASSSTFVAGRESSQIDNTTNKYLDAIVRGSVSVGTTPTANTSINIYVWGAFVSLATTAIDVLDGTDSAETLTNSGVLLTLRPGPSIQVLATTSDIAYPVLPFSVAALFGGALPPFWGLFVAHNTGVALRNNAVNTNAFEYIGVKLDTA
jgi:hypothetical protein